MLHPDCFHSGFNMLCVNYPPKKNHHQFFSETMFYHELSSKKVLSWIILQNKFYRFSCYQLQPIRLWVCCLSDLLSLHCSCRLMSIWRATFWEMSQTWICLWCLNLITLKPHVYYSEGNVILLCGCSNLDNISNMLIVAFIFLHTNCHWHSFWLFKPIGGKNSRRKKIIKFLRVLLEFHFYKQEEW